MGIKMKSINQLKKVYGELMISQLTSWQVKELKRTGSKLRICSNCGTKIVMSAKSKFFSRCPQCHKTFKIYKYLSRSQATKYLEVC